MKPSQLFLRLWVCLEGCSVHIQGCTAAHSSEQRWLGLRGECPRLRSWDVQWQSYGRGLAWVLSPIDVVGGGAADHAALCSLLCPCQLQQCSCCIMAGASAGAWIGLTMPGSNLLRSSTKGKVALSLHVGWWAQRCCFLL